MALAPNTYHLTSQMEHYELLQIHYPDYIHELGHLRVRAWQGAKGLAPEVFSAKEWLDEIDECAMHWIVRDKTNIVASARISLHSTLDTLPYAQQILDSGYTCNQSPIASINRLVVEKEHRKKGIAKLLDKTRIEAARASGAKLILAQPQEHRIKGLENIGFEFICKMEPIPEMPGRPIYLMSMQIHDNIIMTK